VRVKAYIILIDVLGWPLGDLELIDANLNCFALGVQSRAKGKVGGELVGLNISLAIILAKVERLHDEGLREVEDDGKVMRLRLRGSEFKE
jgi:hypothetical protein